MRVITPPLNQGFGAGRWFACGVIVALAHGALVFQLLRVGAPIELPPPDPVPIMIELAAEPEAAAAEASPPAPPDVTSPAAPPVQPLPSEPIVPQAAQAEAVLPAKPEVQRPPKPAVPRPAAIRPTPPRPPVRNPRRAVPAVEPPSRTQEVAPVAAVPPATPAPAPAARSGSATGVSDWKTQLADRLRRAKTYPDSARSRGDQGVVLVTFTIDRAGHVLGASLTRTSGSAVLDEEAVALIRRVDPLPAPPPEMVGATLTLTVPISFALR